MSRIYLSLTILGLAVAATTQARADFRLEAQPTSLSAVTSESVPGGLTSRPLPDQEESLKPGLSPFKVAHGFGEDVPLSFAARQIVPPSVTIQYGPRVDPHAAVSWNGEAPWNRVLAAAVRPLRLRITTSGTSVLISR